MPLPPLNSEGDLPVGVHVAPLAEVVARFGGDTDQRRAVTTRLEHICRLARSTGAVERLIVFGSYVTAKPAPNDVDVVLVMRDDFDATSCPLDTAVLFDHQRADVELGASVFWIRPGLLFGESVEEFVAGWQARRGGGRRGIVEVSDD